MELAFRERPYDLLTVTIASLAFIPFAIGGTGGAVRFVLAVALVLFLPGYAIAAALFPGAEDMDWIRRLALSVGLSIASVALLGLLLDLSPAGVRIETVVPSLLGLTVAICAVAYVRRVRLPAAERLGLSVTVVPPRWRDLTRTDKVLAVAVVAALVSAGGAFAYAAANRPPAEAFTELYLLDPQGGILDYPLSLNVSEGAVVILGIANRESRPMNYTVQVQLVTLLLVYNETTGRNDTVETGRVTVDTFPVNLTDGGRRESAYPFSIASPGDYRLRFLLFAGVPQGDPYRSVDIRIRVS